MSPRTIIILLRNKFASLRNSVLLPPNRMLIWTKSDLLPWHSSHHRPNVDPAGEMVLDVHVLDLSEWEVFLGVEELG
jgi:hypothetical protein